jgi:beta-glucosidase
MNGILKDELGFQGYVVSDWEAQHSGVASTLAGLDMAMPTPKDYWGYNLSVSIRNGSVSESRLDDMATRLVSYQIIHTQC